MNVKEFNKVLQELYPSAKVVSDGEYARIDWGKLSPETSDEPVEDVSNRKKKVQSGDIVKTDKDSSD